MSERRYTEAEVAEIFERAADPQAAGLRPVPSSAGLTLPELQEIGREVGMAPEAVAEAARSLARTGSSASRKTFLGLPLGVGRTVELRRAPTDGEWERLVVDLRETFDARGTVRSEGSFRSWTNGNLQALLEPTADGHRLRLRTLRETSRRFMTMGLVMWGVALAVIVAELLAGRFGEIGASSGPAFLFVFGLGMFGWGAVQLPGWARERLEQMEGIIARLERSVTSTSGELRPGARSSDSE